jgi:LAO/AO transport system kinase
MNNSPLIEQLKAGNTRTLARCISMVENELPGYDELLKSLSFSKKVPLIGITGPPGAGKSSLIAALISHWNKQGKKIGIIAVDPSSPFTRGALMGDRLRMHDHYLQHNVFIRSMASRGSLGGLAPKILEAADVMRAADFDLIIIETVGIGQSEVEIAALADITVLVLVPEAGDEIQTIKSGVMEIADVYALNKADREGADVFYKNLRALSHSHSHNGHETPVVQTIATKGDGISELCNAIEHELTVVSRAEKRAVLLAEKALVMIKNLRTRDINLQQLKQDIALQLNQSENFNLYAYVSQFVNT